MRFIFVTRLPFFLFSHFYVSFYSGIIIIHHGAFIWREKKRFSGIGLCGLSITGTDGSESSFHRLSWMHLCSPRVCRDVIFLIQRHEVEVFSLLSGRVIQRFIFVYPSGCFPLIRCYVWFVLLTHLEIRISVTHCIGKGTYICLVCHYQSWGFCVFVAVFIRSFLIFPIRFPCFHHTSHTCPSRFVVSFGSGGGKVDYVISIACFLLVWLLSRYRRYSLYIVRFLERRRGSYSLQWKGMGGAKEIF